MFLFRIITVFALLLLAAVLSAQPVPPVPGSDGTGGGTGFTFPGITPYSNYHGPLIAPAPLPGIAVGSGGNNRTLSDTVAPFDETDPAKRRTGAVPLTVPMGETVPLPFLPSRPSMTREEIVKQRQREAWQRIAILEQDLRKIEKQTRIQDSLRELLGETDAMLPSVLAEPLGGSKEQSPSTNIKPDANPNAVEQKPPQNNQPTQSELRQKEKTGQRLTEEERKELEHQKEVERIANLKDPEERKKEEEALRKNEERLKRWKERRAEMERGANLFELPPKSALFDNLLSDGKCLLFDGKTLFGWRVQNEGYYGGGKFTVQDGEICSDPKYPGLLYTTNQFGDMSLTMEYKTDADAEVYLLMRTAPSPRDLAAQCYAVILNTGNKNNPRGSILGRNRPATDLVSAINPLAGTITGRENEKKWEESWHRVNVQFEATQLQVIIDNGEPTSFFDAKPLGYGYIGLLVTKGQAKFKDIVWSPGAIVPLIDAVTLERNWRYRQEGENAVRVRTEVIAHRPQIVLQGGPGVVESVDKFNNFVLQLEYNITHTSGRTGVFFRSEPWKERSGYEVSLQNFPSAEERKSIFGVDAGAFRGNKNGRYVRPEDQKWNHLTLVAVDRHFQTWVNGIPVCEWSDNREEGTDAATEAILRKGTIQLLLPDKFTDVQFRNIRISRINPRVEKQRTFDDRTRSTWENIKKEENEKKADRQKDQEMKQGK